MAISAIFPLPRYVILGKDYKLYNSVFLLYIRPSSKECKKELYSWDKRRPTTTRVMAAGRYFLEIDN